VALWETRGKRRFGGEGTELGLGRHRRFTEKAPGLWGLMGDCRCFRMRGIAIIGLKMGKGEFLKKRQNIRNGGENVGMISNAYYGQRRRVTSHSTPRVKHGGALSCKDLGKDHVFYHSTAPSLGGKGVSYTGSTSGGKNRGRCSTIAGKERGAPTKIPSHAHSVFVS